MTATTMTTTVAAEAEVAEGAAVDGVDEARVVRREREGRREGRPLPEDRPLRAPSVVEDVVQVQPLQTSRPRRLPHHQLPHPLLSTETTAKIVRGLRRLVLVLLC